MWLLFTIGFCKIKPNFKVIFHLGENKTGGTTRINFGTLFFLIYLNVSPNLASIGNKILLYVDDTSMVVTNPNLEHSETKMDKINNKKLKPTYIHPQLI
jgi:hypothetical protein